jgi:hypothetical protein
MTRARVRALLAVAFSRVFVAIAADSSAVPFVVIDGGAFGAGIWVTRHPRMGAAK